MEIPKDLHARMEAREKQLRRGLSAGYGKNPDDKTKEWIDAEVRRQSQKWLERQMAGRARTEALRAPDTQSAPSYGAPVRGENAAVLPSMGKEGVSTGRDIARAELSRLHGEMIRVIGSVAQQCNLEVDDVSGVFSRPPMAELPQVSEQLIINRLSVSVDGRVDGQPYFEQLPFGSVIHLSRPRSAVVLLRVDDLDNSASPAEWAQLRRTFFTNLEGVRAVRLEIAEAADPTAHVIRDWLAELDVVVFEAAETNPSMPKEIAFGLAYARGCSIYLAALRERLDRLILARRFMKLDIDTERETLRQGEPKPLDSHIAKIERKCADGLDKFLLHAEGEVKQGAERLAIHVEQQVAQQSDLLVEAWDKDRPVKTHRSGQPVNNDFTLFQLNDKRLTKLFAIFGDNEGPSDFPSLAANQSQALSLFWEKHLRDSIVWGLLKPTGLIGERIDEPWKSIAEQEFFPPVSEASTKQMVEHHISRLRQRVLEAMPEIEIRKKVDLLGVFPHIPEAWKMIMQRFSGLFSMLMLFGGLSVMGSLKGLHKSEGDPVFAAVVFVGLFVALYVWAYMLLRSSREETWAISQIKARDTVAKAVRQEMSDLSDEWFKTFAANAKASLPDLIRRVRSELDGPQAEKVAHWRLACDNAGRYETQHARLEKGLAAALKQVDETRKYIQARAAALAKVSKSALSRRGAAG